jgi:hypothetical protein
MHPITRLLLVAYFLEVGLVLLVVPWSPFWDRNFFSELLPALKPVLGAHFIRGGVSGLGVVNLCAGFAELASLVRREPRRPSPAES